MSADTFAPGAANLRRALTFVFAANAATQFAIQAWFAWRFAAEVWKLPFVLSFGVPLALDIYVINLMVTAYLLRSARLRTRAYVWIALALGIGAQLGAAEAFASHEAWGVAARVASLVPAAFLALSLHTLIIVAQHTDYREGRQRRVTLAERRRARALVKALRDSGPADPVIPPPVVRPHLPPALTPGAFSQAATPTEVRFPVAPVAVPKVSRPAPAPSRPAAPAAKAGRRSLRDPQRDLAVKRVRAGESAADVARSMALNPRTVQLWVKAARDQQSVTPVAPAISPSAIAPTDAPVPKGI
jgi:hypothetical protein